MNNFADLASARLAGLKPQASASTDEIPAGIDDLIDNKMYRNRYKRLIREGHLADLLELATLAGEKDKPSHWFAKACSVKMWERTLDFLAKLRAVQSTAERVARRLGTEVNKFIYKQIWRGANVERWAGIAVESGRDRNPLRLFAYLCKRAAGPPGTARAA